MSVYAKLVYTLILVTLGGALQLAHSQDVPAQAVPPSDTTPVDPLAGSYSLGLYFGNQLHTSGLDGTVSVEQLERGLREGLAGKVATEEDKTRMSQMLRNGREAVAAHNRAQAGEFLAQNGKIDGVVTTASGLQYTIIKPGAGPTPKTTDQVTVHYRGRLLDGTQFDSSDAHAMPATFRLSGGVIKGWQEALLLMKQGAQWRAFVPPDLAYGDTSRPGIPPGSLLVFDLELVKIEPPERTPLQGTPPKGPGAPAIKKAVPQK
jgi:FKBP-type peptidyl-prolyl cis-trans isomerase FklB